MSGVDDPRDGDAPDAPPVAPPVISRLGRASERRNRVLRRASTSSRSRERFRRRRRQLPIAELLGQLIERHGLTDEVRRRCVYIYWHEIVGERTASKAFPSGFADGTLQVSAVSSAWVHELRFLKDGLIAKVNAWVDHNRVWLGPPPLVLDMRAVLVIDQRDPLVDREHVRRLQRHHAWRTRPRPEVPPPAAASDAELDAIREETRAIVDPELRALIERVRVKWNK